MTTLAQRKALAQVFTEYSDKTWGRLMSDTLIEEDKICDYFQEEEVIFLQGFVSELADEFQTVFDAGVCLGDGID